ncbi:lysophospholipid acyltransferase family protein [Colwellia sp. D2M02]|uniref:lysophospholipid acyltransferase family protein n=1 Tax=Colwellia sp. D2M02 TaxID=2841562 RepID=UPI002090D8CD|nr:lysophospholipid acyltransferase family protein [Colwellia sp. D2M02]
MYITIATESVALSLCKQHGKTFNRLRRFFSIRIVRSAGARVNLSGSIDADTDILIVNHQSMTDIFSLEEVVGNDVRFVGRTGIMDRWPVSRIVNLVGHITVDQKDRRAIIKLLKDVKVCKGKKVIIFPEGTRSQTGKIEPFEPGTKILVEKLKLKAQPVVIKNILSIYNESNKSATSGTIEIEALPPVNIQEGWYEKAHQDMSNIYQQ